MVSCLKQSHAPNSDKTILYNLQSRNKEFSMTSIKSPLRQHIQKKVKLLKLRNRIKKEEKNSQSKNEDEKQLKPTNFVRCQLSNAKSTRFSVKSIVKQVSDGQLTSKVISTADGGAKFMPKIPIFRAVKDESEKINFFPRLFVKTQPKGSDSKLLRLDRSLPLNLSEIDVGQTIRTSKTSEESNLLSVETDEKQLNSFIVTSADVQNIGTIKKTFKNIIANKLQNQHKNVNKSFLECEAGCSGNDGIINSDQDFKAQSNLSSTSLSSKATNFSLDSGSFLMLFDEKIRKSQLNIANKNQVRTLEFRELFCKNFNVIQQEKF